MRIFSKKKNMSELVPIFQSSYLYEIELAKSKLASLEIPSYIKNEYVNNIAVFPISQNYFLLVSEHDFEEAEKILAETHEDSTGPGQPS
jgi:hypothetical protein